MKTFKQINKLILAVLTGRCVNKATPTSDTEIQLVLIWTELELTCMDCLCCCSADCDWYADAARSSPLCICLNLYSVADLLDLS